MAKRHIPRLTGRTPRPTKGDARFDPAQFLETVAKGRTISTHPKKQIIFTQGDVAGEVIYIKKGKVKVTVISEHGKEAIVALLGVDEFLGEGCLIGQPKRLATATAMTECIVMRVEKTEILRVLQDEPQFSQMFISHILARNARSRRRSRRPAFQLHRKAAGAAAAAAREFRQGGQAGADRRKDQPGDARRDDRHDAIARQPFYEQLGGNWGSLNTIEGHLEVHSSLLSVVLNEPTPARSQAWVSVTSP